MVWTATHYEEDSIDGCRTRRELRDWVKRQAARRRREYLTTVYPWMNDYSHLVGEIELSCRAITIDPSEEWRSILRQRTKQGWSAACVSFYSRYERHRITKKLASMGDHYVSPAYRCEDKFAIVHVINNPEIVVLFKEVQDRDEFVEWAKRFERPVLLVTKKDHIPEAAKRLLRGRNHYVLVGTNATAISVEVMTDEIMREIQSHL